MSIFIPYIKSKYKQLLLVLLCLFSSGLVLYLSGTSLPNLILSVLLVLLIYGLYFRWRYKGYKREFIHIQKITNDLDNRYLANELLERPEDIETIVYYELLRAANRDMCNKVTQNSVCLQEYRDFIEEWIHELKTPLTSLELMSSSKDISSITFEVERMKYILDKCLNYTRIDVLEKDYHVEDILFSNIIHQLLMDEKNAIREKKLTINIQISEKCYVMSDPKWVKFIYGQILNNAIKYSDEGTELHFCERKEKETVWLGIQDSGMGIKSQDLPRIWEKGYTGASTKRESASGIGLYLVKKCADKMNVKINCVSAPGKGALFEIGFPLSD